MARTEITTPSRPLTDDTQPRRRAVPAIAVAVAVATVPAVLGDTIVSLIARQIGGVSGKFTPVQPAAYIALTIIGLVAGALGWYTITRVSARPGRILRWLVPAAIVLSFIPDIAVGISKTLPYTTWAGVAALMVMHVVVAGAGVASYHSFLPSRDDRRRERPGQDRGARRGDAGRDSGAAAQPGAPSCPGRCGRKPRAGAAPGLVPGLTVASAAARPGWVAYPGGTQPPPRTAAISPPAPPAGGIRRRRGHRPCPSWAGRSRRRGCCSSRRPPHSNSRRRPSADATHRMARTRSG